MFENFLNKFRNFGRKNSSDSAQTTLVQCPVCGHEMAVPSSQKTFTCRSCGTTLTTGYSFDEEENPSNKHPFGEDEDDEGYEDNFSDANLEHYHVATKDQYNYVYAYIEKIGSTYSGEIPGMTFSKVTFCDSYSECFQQLIDIFKEEREKDYYESPIQDFDNIRRAHPKAKIFKLS